MTVRRVFELKFAKTCAHRVLAKKAGDFVYKKGCNERDADLQLRLFHPVVPGVIRTHTTCAGQDPDDTSLST